MYPKENFPSVNSYFAFRKILALEKINPTIAKSNPKKVSLISITQSAAKIPVITDRIPEIL